MSDDKIAEIRARHLRDERWRYSPSMLCPQSHDDRAALLAEVDRRGAEIERLRVENFENWKFYNVTYAKERKIEEPRAETKRLRSNLEGKP